MRYGSIGSTRFLAYLEEKRPLEELRTKVEELRTKVEKLETIEAVEYDTGRKWINGETVYGIALDIDTNTTVNGALIAVLPTGLKPINATQVNSGRWVISTSNTDGSNRSNVRYNSLNGEVTLFKTGTNNLFAPFRLVLEYLK